MNRAISLTGVLAFLFLTSVTLLDETCGSYELFVKGAKYTWTNYDQKYKETGSTEFLITSVEHTTSGALAMVEATAYDSSGKGTGSVTSEYSCKNEMLLANTRYLLLGGKSESTNMETTEKSVPLQYPFNMKVGDTLENASVSHVSKVKSPGAQMPTNLVFTTSMEMTNRIVDSVETITTPVGTYVCSKIRFKQKLTAKGPDGKKDLFSYDAIEWFNPKVGCVRIEYYLNGNLETVTTLTKIYIPK